MRKTSDALAVMEDPKETGNLFTYTTKDCEQKHIAVSHKYYNRQQK